MTDPSWLHMLSLALVGFAAGILNVLAGGGSLLTLPVLIFMGLPAATANGTNRIAILVQNLFAMRGFHRHGALPWRLALICAVPATAGSYLGAQWAVDVGEALFRTVLAGIMLGILALTLWDPLKHREFKTRAHLSKMHTVLLLVVFFVIGLYGGFVQAGVGFLIIAGLLLQGLDLIRINAVKVAVIFCFTVMALVVFIRHGQVDYRLGFCLAAGNAAGGWLAASLAVKKGHVWIRRIVSLAVIVFAVRLLLG